MFRAPPAHRPGRNCASRTTRASSSPRCAALSDAALDGEIKWQIRNWAGKTIEAGSRKITIPPGAEPLEVAVPRPPGEHKFLEAEFALSAPEQTVPAIQAYYMAPVAAAEGAAQLEPSSPFGMGLYLYRYRATPRACRRWSARRRWARTRA